MNKGKAIYKKANRAWFFIVVAISFLLSGCGDINAQKAESTPQSVIHNDSQMEVIFFDVGQGDCALVISNGETLLIDTGNNDKEKIVREYLENAGVERIDYLIATHPDSDHIGGMDIVLEHFECKTVIMPDVYTDTKTYEELMNLIDEKGISITFPRVGDTYELGDAIFTIIAPGENDYGNNTNNYSVGIILEFGSTRFLFAGDAEGAAERDMLSTGIDLTADVYKVSHHGSSSSSSQAFLNAVDPVYAVISCGKNNTYGHPHAETLANLADMDTMVYRTDELGSIRVKSDGKNLKWSTLEAENELKENLDTEKKEATKNETARDEIEKDETVKEEMSEMGYVLNKNTKKFHDPNCGSVSEMLEENKEETRKGREELIKGGYTSCGRCKP